MNKDSIRGEGIFEIIGCLGLSLIGQAIGAS